MRKKYNIRIPKGKEVKNVKTGIVNGNIKVSFDLEDVFEPKDGDFVTDFDGDVFIVKDTNDYDIRDCYVGYSKLTGFKFDIVSWARPKRYSTMQEKQSFLERLKNECGKTWNPETKHIEDIRYRANKGDKYYYVDVENRIKVLFDFERGNEFNNKCYDLKNYFRTPEAAKKVADQIKDIFKNSKAE